MTDKVDITAPNLPKVEEKKHAGADRTQETTEPRHLAGAQATPEITETSPPGVLIRARIPAITADQSEPSLPEITAGKVAETASILEPVPEPANTLDLDDEPEAVASKERQKKLVKVELVPDPVSQPVATTKQRRAVPRALGGDGFEGASLEVLPEVKPAENATANLIELARASAFWIVLALIAAVLLAFGAWFFA